MAVTIISTYVLGRGADTSGDADGSVQSASFIQPLGICCEEMSLYIYDGALGAIKLVTPTECLISCLGMILLASTRTLIQMLTVQLPAFPRFYYFSEMQRRGRES